MTDKSSTDSLPAKDTATAYDSVETLRGNKDLGGVFGNSGELAEHYRPIEGYEGMHRFDPKAEWTEKEEARVVRQVCYFFPPFPSRKKRVLRDGRSTTASARGAA